MFPLWWILPYALLSELKAECWSSSKVLWTVLSLSVAGFSLFCLEMGWSYILFLLDSELILKEYWSNLLVTLPNWTTVVISSRMKVTVERSLKFSSSHTLRCWISASLHTPSSCCLTHKHAQEHGMSSLGKKVKVCEKSCWEEKQVLKNKVKAFEHTPSPQILEDEIIRKLYLF